jgi:hypothetical protein
MAVNSLRHYVEGSPPWEAIKYAARETISLNWWNPQVFKIIFTISSHIISRTNLFHTFSLNFFNL